MRAQYDLLLQLVKANKMTDRTYSELDVLFERRVPARKFKSTKVDPFRGDSVVLVSGEERMMDKEDVVELEK